MLSVKEVLVYVYFGSTGKNQPKNINIFLLKKKKKSPIWNYGPNYQFLLSRNKIKTIQKVKNKTKIISWL